MTATEDISPNNVERTPNNDTFAGNFTSIASNAASIDNVTTASLSSSPAQQTSSSSLVEEREAMHEEPIDPQIITLQGMFPDFDVSLLQSVLESVGGDQDKAIDILLGMSDPSYNSTVRNETTELDEQFARTLLLEESQREPTSWRPHDPSEGLPYVPRVGGPNPPHGPASSPHEEGDTITQIQEQLGKFAETGKKSFTSFLSKVKAKIQEFDNPQGSQGHPTPSRQGSSPSYYDPNPPPPRGYDTDSSPRFSNQPAPVNPQQTLTELDQPSVTTTSVSGASTVDPAKIGLLPKRPVSLGSSPQPSKAGDDEDLEYVENPFEESSRH